MSLVRRRAANWRGPLAWSGGPYLASRYGPGLLRAAQQKAARYLSYTKTRRGRKITSGIGITTQHDQRNVYRKKTMPRRKKRVWKKFVKKVQFISEKELGTRTVVLNSSISQSNSTSGQHGVLSLNLYGQKSTNVYLSDLYYMSTYENISTDPTAAGGAYIDKQSHMFFNSAVMDITIRNTSTKWDGSTQTIASECQLELDIYEISCKQDFATSGTNYQNLGSALQNEGNQEQKLKNVGNNLTILQRGATPFDSPTALSRLGVKVYKKTKYFIPAGNTITYQMRDPRRHSCLIRELNDEEGANKPKWTKWILCVYKLVPGLTIGAASGASVTYQERIQVGCTRKYMYKIDGVMENRNGYVADSNTPSNPA